MIVSKILNINAHQKLSTMNPGTIDPASIMTMALITSKNKPNVTTVSGIVKITKRGLTVAFSMEIITATMKEVIKASKLLPVMAIPGRR